MKKWFNRHIEVIQIVVSLLIVVVAGYDMIEKPARPAILLTVVFGSIGVGASIGVYFERRRLKRLVTKQGTHSKRRILT